MNKTETLQYKQTNGFTLIELVIALVIISVALTGILSISQLTIQHSADPMIQRQSIAIAEAYLEEILLQSYIDPDGTNVGENRSTFDNVDDYNGLNDSGAIDHTGSAIAGLSAYSITVSVANVTLASAVPAKQVNVTVTHAALGGITLTGYKTHY